MVEVTMDDILLAGRLYEGKAEHVSKPWSSSLTDGSGLRTFMLHSKAALFPVRS